MIISKSTAREAGNKIDKVLGEIKDIQANIDRSSDKIDNELNSCSRELINAQTTLTEIQPQVDMLLAQVGQDAPPHVKAMLESVAMGITGKVQNALNNLAEVQRNVKDVDKLTDEIDTFTDNVNKKITEIDELTDKLQG